MLDKNFLRVIKKIESVHKTFAKVGSTKEYEKFWPIGKIINFPSISRNSAKVIYNLILKNKPKIVIELGTCIGYSTLWIAQASKDYNGKVYTIDLSKKEQDFAKIFFKKAKLTNIKTVNSEISKAIEKWPKNKKIDFLFIDADKNNYLNYLKKLEPFLNKKAIIVADNILSHKELLNSYVDYLKNNQNYKTTLIRIDKGLLVSRRIQ